MSDTTRSGRNRFDRAVRELRRPVYGDDLAILSIMRAVRRQVRFRWIRRAALVAAMTTVLLTAGLWHFGVEDSTDAAADGRSFVQFVYVGSRAREVSLVGSFNDWDPHANPLQREGTKGVWSAEVPLPPGHHEYAFNVDGQWVPDDDAPLAASDEFGVANSVILVQ